MTVADGMLSLGQAHEHNSVVRKIRVVKMRGQAHMAGSHTFPHHRATACASTRACCRRWPTTACPAARSTREPRRISTGVPGLDAMLHGGIPQGHSMLVVGPTGSGKTILGTRFLQEGERNGEKGVAVFFEKGTLAPAQRRAGEDGPGGQRRRWSKAARST